MVVASTSLGGAPRLRSGTRGYGSIFRVTASASSRPLGDGAEHARRAPMLTINGLTVRPGGRTIPDRATASLPGKSRTALLGPHGAGKSPLTEDRKRGVAGERV